MQSYIHAIERQKRLRTYGVLFADWLMQTHTFRQWMILSRYSKPLASNDTMDESNPVEDLTELAWLRMPFGLSAINFPVWGAQTLVCTLLAARTYVCDGCKCLGKRNMTLLIDSNHS